MLPITAAVHMQECFIVNLSPTIGVMSEALVQLQARYHHRGEAASEEYLSAATFVSRHARRPPDEPVHGHDAACAR